jgi:hypothetical protein
LRGICVVIAYRFGYAVPHGVDALVEGADGGTTLGVRWLVFVGDLAPAVSVVFHDKWFCHTFRDAGCQGVVLWGRGCWLLLPGSINWATGWKHQRRRPPATATIAATGRSPNNADPMPTGNDEQPDRFDRRRRRGNPDDLDGGPGDGLSTTDRGDHEHGPERVAVVGELDE